MSQEISALVFDAYGTIFDVHSVTRLAEAYFPGRGAALSAAWRGKQLEYTWQRSLMGRYAPFSQVTREALEFACMSLALSLDGSKIETLVDSSKGDARPGKDETKVCVGITVDPDRGQIYWTQKGPANAGKGRIFRAKIDIPKGETAANRTDIETLFDGLPEPIDLELDLKNRFLYWTDRGDAPRGNTVNRAPLDGDFNKRQAPEILLTHLEEGIGIALDFKGGRMFTTDLAGNIFCAKLDGTEKKPVLVAQGNLTGIAYAEINTKGN